MRDGQRVSFVGNPALGLAMGDHGRVLSASGAASHVMWTSGARKGAVDLIDDVDLVPTRTASAAATVADALDDSLHFEASVALAVRDTFDTEGAPGLINAMSEAGHLARLASAAEDALELVAARVREDIDIAPLLGQLDADEREQVISTLSTAVLRDAFSEGD